MRTRPHLSPAPRCCFGGGFITTILAMSRAGTYVAVHPLPGERQLGTPFLDGGSLPLQRGVEAPLEQMFSEGWHGWRPVWAYRAGIRSAPSSLITSPLSISFSTM